MHYQTGWFVIVKSEAPSISNVVRVALPRPTVQRLMVPPLTVITLLLSLNLPATFNTPPCISTDPLRELSSAFPTADPTFAVPDTSLNNPSLIIEAPFTVSVPPFTRIPPVETTAILLPLCVSVPLILSNPVVIVKAVAILAVPVRFNSVDMLVPLLTVTVLNNVVDDPEIVAAVDPLKLMVEVLPVNVPLFVQSPPILCINDPAVKVVKASLMVKLPAVVIAAVTDFVVLPEPLPF